MFYVYILQSISHPEHHYIGSTKDLKRRLEEHNNGDTIHTNEFKPWKVISYHAFSNSLKAKRFELYLKTGSGRAFAKNHL